MRRTKVIPIVLIAVMLVSGILAYRTWNDGQQDQQIDRMAECVTGERTDC